MLTLWNQFDDLFSDDFLRAARRAPRAFSPPVDIEETKDGYRLVADVPGVSPEDIEVTVHDGTLVLKGQRKAETRTEEAGYRRLERSFGAFQRSFVLPKGVDSEAVSAKVEAGQLFVHIPKPVSQLPRKVAVRVEA